MRVTLYSEDTLSVYVQSPGEPCGVVELDRHIRTLQKARQWLVRERMIRRQKEQTAKLKQAAK